MREFKQLVSETIARYPMAAELWTFYHLETHPYARCDSDWGMCLAYHFDRSVLLDPWLQLVIRVQDWVQSRPELREIVEFVPFYEVGADFFTQCKPPFDGGYPTTHYEEFLDHGSCAPAPWFYQQLAELHRRVAEAIWSLPSDATGRLLRKVVHATFIHPYAHLFWKDEAGWAVYQPNVAVEDVQEWLG